jgi:hypothetical protein
MKGYFNSSTLFIFFLIFSCTNHAKKDLLIGKWLFEYNKRVRSQVDTSRHLVITFNENGSGKREFVVKGVTSDIKENIFSLTGNQLIVVEKAKTDVMLIVELSNEVLRLTKPHYDTFTFNKIK